MSLLCTIRLLESRDFGPTNGCEAAARPVKSFDTAGKSHYNPPAMPDAAPSANGSVTRPIQEESNVSLSYGYTRLDT
jgi:hypothetical protein